MEQKISSGKTIAKLTTHTWDEGKVTTEPTCTAKGVRTFTCSICAKTKTASIAATGHRHTEIRRKKTQPAAKMVIQEIHIALIVRKQFHMVRPSKKPVTILGMTEKSQKSLLVQQTA